MSVNQVVVIGRLTRNVEVKTIGDKNIGIFTVAVDRDYGEKVSDFFSVKVWNGVADSCAKYIGKGSLVCVSGRLQNRTWESQDGKKNTVTEIIASHVEFLSKKESKGESNKDTSSLKTVDEPLPF